MRIRVRMTAHDVDEEHRAATPLELFFDLVFVIAVAAASNGLHDGLVEGHGEQAVIGYLAVFFAIWWAWMNFTWFASAYDTDDAVYRLSVFVIMIGALILAAGASDYVGGQRYGVVLGYVVMRVAMVALWLRAAVSFRDGRACALRYAIGIGILQVLWVARLAIADTTIGPVSFVVLAAAELAIPYWAELAGPTAWHPSHIAERYGLFTLIVLGEALLAATQGVRSVLSANTPLGELVPIIVGGLLLVFSMWWIYFDLPTLSVITAARKGQYRRRASYLWGYGHYFIFCSVAATGAGIAVAVDHAAGAGHLSGVGAGLAVTIPVSVYLLAVWGLESPLVDPIAFRTWAIPLAIVLMLASSFTPETVLLSGLVLTILLIGGSVAAHFRPLHERGIVDH